MSKLLHELFNDSGRGVQTNLPGTNHISHSNLGKELEDALNRTHYRYALQKKAHVTQNPKTWVYTNKDKYDYLTMNGAGATVARTSDGKYLQAKKSNIDFSGNVGNLHIAFDAKQTKGKSFPLKNVERHQIEKLLLTQECGAIAGLMVWMSELHRVFFIKAGMLNDCLVELLFKQGRSSISLKQMESESIEIKVQSDLREVDWLPITERLR